MEKRRSGRYPVELNADIVLGERTYRGHVTDVSECGVGYLTTSFDYVSSDVTPERVIDMDLQTPAGDTLRLNCEVKWFLSDSPRNGKLTLGMKIIDPPLQYRKYVEKLSTTN